LAAGNVIEQLRLWEKIRKENLNVRDAEKISTKNVNDKLTKLNKNQKTSQLSDIEQSLSGKFSTKVEVNGSEQKGAIQIKYFSREDLERIYALLLRNEVI
jgi:ParB family transcriptional regulator, chromosome partitioning protein